MRGLNKTILFGGAVFGLATVLTGVMSLTTGAADQPSGFALSVSPSPLVVTVKPGVATNVELSIRNEGKSTEHLKILPRAFTTDKQTGEVKLKDTPPADISNWISFNQPIFSVDSGQSVTEKIHIAMPKETGFSYSFAFLISRASGESTGQGNAIHGSVAVFTLISVDRPGAVRKFDIVKFAPSAPIVEYLPTDFKMTFKNTGNTIVQPSGNIFIQRGSDDGLPISTLPVNNKNGYLLPDSLRTLTATWSDGFPVYKTTTSSDGKPKQDLTWDWSKLTDFRFGQYTAKLVAIYNDGQRDIPVVSEVTFWVIPWRALLVLVTLIVFVLFMLRKLIHYRTEHALKRAMADKDKQE